MRKAVLCCLATCALLLGRLPPARCCTIFKLVSNGRVLVGENFDFVLGDGDICANQRGVAKTAFTCHPASSAPLPAWTARYGSLTFNWWGREFPFSGMNEAGLCVCASGLSTSEYPPLSGRPVLFVAQVVQYLLDTVSTVDAALQALSAVDIAPPLGATGHLHYFLCDTAGQAAIAAWEDGRAVYYRDADLPVPVLTNTSYRNCRTSLESGRVPAPDPITSTERFITTARALTALPEEDPPEPIETAFSVLSLSHMGAVTLQDGIPMRSLIATEWSIVFDLTAHRISFRTFENSSVRSIDLALFDFSCTTQPLVFDVQDDTAGDISARFTPCTPERNRAFFKTPCPILPLCCPDPREALQRMLFYAESLCCVPGDLHPRPGSGAVPNTRGTPGQHN